MDPDGQNKATLPLGVGGEPSYALHGGRRWFLTIQFGELFAIAEDGQVQGPLTDPADAVILSEFHSLLAGAMRWAKDDRSTKTEDEADTFVGYMGTDSGDQAIYRLSIAWPGGVPVPDGYPVEVLSEPDIPAGMDLVEFDWAPDGNQLVYRLDLEPWAEPQGEKRLQIKDVPSGQRWPLADGGWAEWSPDGSRIAFAAAHWAIATIRPDGSDLRVILRGHAGKAIVVTIPKWAPSSEHLVYVRQPFGFDTKVEPRIFRATATGGGKTNLTAELEPNLPGQSVLPRAWR